MATRSLIFRKSLDLRWKTLRWELPSATLTTTVFATCSLPAWGAITCFETLGKGKFEEITETAGVGGDPDRWSTSAGWFDYDSDGDLDLFVCNYLVWSRQYDQSQNFQLVGGGRAYGRPQNFEGTFPYLYRNDGDGTFTDVSEQAGIQIRNGETGVPLSKSLGLAFCDFDSNGFPDVVVSNDTVQNLLLQNDGKGKFTDVGVLTGIAFDSSGNARGAMGIDVASFRGPKALAVAIGNFSNEMTALYVTPRDRLSFYDEAISTGLGPSTRLLLTFGLFYTDYDLDGRSDLFCANGHLEEDINRVQPQSALRATSAVVLERRSRICDRVCPSRSAACRRGSASADGWTKGLRSET